jgi:hypothetical protein
MHED